MMSGILLRSRFRAALSASLLIVSVLLSSLSMSLGGYAVADLQGGGDLIVWIPPKMLTGERYSGVLIVTDAVDYSRTAMLVSSNPTVKVPERVTVEPGMHQAAFEIDLQSGESIPAGGGGGGSSSDATKISAVMDGGMFGYASAILYDSINNVEDYSGMVRLLAFNSTSLPFARVVVAVAAGWPSGDDDDDDYYYSLAHADTDVTIAYPGGTKNVTVDSRSGYGVVDIPLVNGPNRISVFGRPGDTITVTRTPVDPAITVKIAALPIIPAWTPEWGYQRSWLLVDAEWNGKPVRGDFEAIVTSSNPDIIEVEKKGTTTSTYLCGLPCAIPVRGNSEGNARLGVHLAGLGGGAVDIITAPPVRYLASEDDVHDLASRYIARSAGTSPQSSFVINDISLSSYASEKVISSAVTDGPVYGLVGHYATLVANYTTIEVTGNVTTMIPRTFTKTVPVVIPGVEYHILSSSSSAAANTNGAGHDRTAAAEWNYNYFNGLTKVDASMGISGLMLPKTSSTAKRTSVGVGSSHAAMTSIEIPLSEPAGAAEVKGDLSTITMPGTGVRLAAYLVGGTVHGGYYEQWDRGVSVAPSLLLLSGIEQLPPQEGGEEDGLSPLGNFPQQQEQDNNNSAMSGTQLQVDVPPISYPAEGLTFAAHITQNGIPLLKVDPLYELGRGDPEKAGEVQEIESVFIHSHYVTRAKVHAVMNAIVLSVQWPEVLKLDRPYNMTVMTSVPGARIQVSGDVYGIASQSSGDAGTITASTEVTLYPAGEEGDKRVVISASKPGWVTATEEKVIPAQKHVELTINAVDGEGDPVAAPFILEYETVDGKSGKIEGRMTPYVFDVRPLASKPNLTFLQAAPAEANNGTGYIYRTTRQTGDYSFTGIYERQIMVTVVNGFGSGYYAADQSVHIEADPDRQVLGFAVVEKFSHWEYDPDVIYMSDRSDRVQDAAIISAAGEDIIGGITTITAVYDTDFTTLAILILSPAIAVGAYAYREEIRTILGAYRKERAGGGRTHGK